VYALDGSRVRTIEHEYKSVRITKEEMEALNKSMLAAIDIQAPKYRPAFQGVTADEDGRVFVATWERPESGKGYLYDVFGREGAFVTQVALDYPPQIWKDSRLYTIEEDGERSDQQSPGARHSLDPLSGGSSDLRIRQNL
jgi:hypothetical protein